MSVNIVHVSISDALGGAAIAAGRLHRLMNNDKRLSSKMLVLIKNSDDVLTLQLSFYARQKARVSNLINNQIGRIKTSYGLFSFSLFGNNLNENDLVKEADIIYIHWINNGMLSWDSIEKLFKLGKPVFLFSHDMWYFTGGCHQSNGCDQYKVSCNSCKFFKDPFLQKVVSSRYLKKKSAYAKYSNVHHILPSTLFYNMALESGIIPENNVHYISNILDSDKFIPPKKQGHKKIRVLYGAMGGKTNPYKGWEHFMYLIQNIEESVLETIEVYLFGYDFTETEIKELPIEVKSYGMVYSEDEMVEIYQNTDVFIFPSLQESFGQTLFEAMACGAVPIAYNVGAASDLIIHESNGYILPVGDKEQLVASFHKLVSVDDLTLMRERARKEIDENFSSKLLIEKHMKVLNIK